MPKGNPKPLGDAFLDRKQAVGFDENSPDDELQKLIIELKVYKRLEAIGRLFKYFNINPESEDAWMALSFELAEHYVPAMTFEKKRGSKIKWDDDRSLLFIALYHKVERENPEQSKKQNLFSMVEAAIGTPLHEDIKGLSYRTLEDRYDTLMKVGYSFLREEIKQFSDFTVLKLYKALEKNFKQKNP